MGLHGEAIISALRSSIEKDPIKRFAVFGNHVADEHDVRSFSKNEIRQITEYIENEQQVPVLDSDILVNVLRVNPRAVDYERQRFALNYRLLKDLEFVGVAGANLWATRKLLDKIGANKRIKAADMAAFVNHLEERLQPRFNNVAVSNTN
jgi:predicted MPP superfamily phosphohydrolase